MSDRKIVKDIHPVLRTKDGRAIYKKKLRVHYENNLDAAVSRRMDIPDMSDTYDGPWRKLYQEALGSYRDGHYHATIAMLATTSERIAWEVLKEKKSKKIEKLIDQPLGSLMKELKNAFGMNIKTIGMINKLRIKYLHPKDQNLNASKEVLKAFRYFRDWLKETNSIFKDYDLIDGKLVKKSIK